MNAKQKVAEYIYRFLYWLDIELGAENKYKGESVPYCGHAYWGHNGLFTRSSYNEVGGGKYADLFFIVVGHEDGDNKWFIDVLPGTVRVRYVLTESGLVGSFGDLYNLRQYIKHVGKGTCTQYTFSVTLQLRFNTPYLRNIRIQLPNWILKLIIKFKK
jgi:hypothetical protein